MKKRNDRKQIILRWGLVAVNMLVIFLFSAQSGDSSGELSGFVAACMEKIPLLGMILMVFDIRKLAHFSIYFILGVLTLRAVTLHSGKTRMQVAAALLICFCYACTDEFHQSFVPGRGPSFRDVLIDTCGALTGVMIVLWYHHRKKPKGNPARQPRI